MRNSESESAKFKGRCLKQALILRAYQEDFIFFFLNGQDAVVVDQALERLTLLLSPYPTGE